MSVFETVWWQVFPLGATGALAPDAARDPALHRLRRLDAWLDYAVELGATGLLLGPIFESSSHGYDTLDHFRIDARLGDDADVDHLVAEASARGLTIVLDGVFNHVGREHPRAGELALRDGHGNPVSWEGHDVLVTLDHASPVVIDLVSEVMLHWLRRGIAGWRLDVAYAVPSQFWRDVLARVRQEFPDALFLGEVIHGDYAAIAREGTLNSITGYELWKAIWSSINDANMWELAHAVERHDEFSRDLVLNTFLGNHDVSRIASVVGLDGAVLALAVLMSVPGMPSVYYLDEQGWLGAKGTGWDADAALRPELPASPGELPEDGRWMFRLYQGLIAMRRANPWLIRSRVRVAGKDNGWIHLETTGEGHTLRTEVTLVPERTARVVLDGAEVWRWPLGL